LTTARALSPDSRTLVTGHLDGAVVLWGLSEGRERRRFQAHPRQISGLSFSPDGQVLASWSTVRGIPSEATLWDPGTARALAGVPRITGYVISAAFVDDGRGLVILEHDLKYDASKNKVISWDLARGPKSLSPGAPTILCSKMAYSPGGRWLATGATAGDVTLSDATTGAPVKTLAGPFAGIEEIAASTDGNSVAVSEATGVSIWDVGTATRRAFVPCRPFDPPVFSADGERLATLVDSRQAIALIGNVTTLPRRVSLEMAPGRELQFAFSLDGKILAGGGIGLLATLCDASSGRKLAEFVDKSRRPCGLIFAAQGRSLIVPSEDGPIRVWHFEKAAEPSAQLTGHEKEVWALVFAPDGKTLLSAGDDHLIKIWDTREGNLKITLEGHGSLVTSLAINRAGSVLASASFDNSIRLWDLTDGSHRTILTGHTDRVRAVAFSPDGKTLASGSSDQTVRLWDLASGKAIFLSTAHTEAVRAVAFDPSGSFVLSTGDDRTIRVIGLKQKHELLSLACSKPNSSLAFSPDGTILAAGDDRGNVSFWDVATWSRRISVKGSDATIWGLDFSPDGRTLAAACGDAKVRLWDPISGQVVLVLDGHSQRVNAVAFSPDGRTLASADHKGEIKLWQAGPSDDCTNPP
jgi:eukaryotic-like serine/threonine-protein kinase